MSLPRLVATDLDGTLVRTDGTVSAYTHDVIAELDERGVPVVFVTGRPLRWAADVFQYVGARMRGERLGHSAGPEQLKLAAGAVLLSPCLPLLFMGEEYGESAPFPYFIHHGDPELVAAVRRGRQEEFAAFAWQGEIPDPQAETTFLSAKIDPQLRRKGMHATLFALYRELLRLRKALPPLRRLSRAETEVAEIAAAKVLVLRRWADTGEVLCLFNFSDAQCTVSIPLRLAACRKLLDSADERWGGGGSPAAGELPAGSGDTRVTLAPWSFVLYASE